MIQRPKYYRVKSKVDSLPEGTLVIAWKDVQERTEVSNGTETFFYKDSEFIQYFEPCPEGDAALQTEIQSLFKHIAELPLPSPTNNQVSLPLPGELNQQQALITTQQKNTVIEAKKQALQTQAKANTLKLKLNNALALQQKALELLQGSWNEKLQQLTYAITSINLYLGRDEEIVCIQEGQVAPKDEPISIRQTVLFMDEETALHADEGGLDFQTLEDFDQWVCKPENLQQLLPEPKGILGMKLRRENKCYANEEIWNQIMLQMANGGTYILVRNGNKLWRIWNDIEIPEHLFPTQQEYNDLFHDQWQDEPLRPGTHAYQTALEKTAGLQRRYLQIVLLMQGLLDRTRIFHPLRTERINLMDPNPDQSVIRLIRDAENLLADGKPDYQEWHDTLNASLEPGKRIVFGGTSYQKYQYESHKEQSSLTRPKFTEWPDPNNIYTIKDISAVEELYFAYSPKERKNATFHFSRFYPFILNFDDLTLQDLEYYLNDRRHRHEYLDSFPILQAAKALKLQEAHQEKHFITLLITEAAKQANSEPTTLQPLVLEVVKWWKQKNRVARSLTERETLAYSQILKEIALRIQIRRAHPGEAISRLLWQPNTLVLAKDTGKTLVRLTAYPHIKGLVKRESFTLTGKTLATKEWYAPDNEIQRWGILKAGEAWKEWPKHGRNYEYLTEPEVQMLWQQLQDILTKDKQLQNLVAVTQDNESFYVFGMFSQYYAKKPSWECQRWQWTREKGKLQLRKESHLHTELGENLNTKTADTVEFDYEKEHVRKLTPEVRKLPFSAFGSRILLFDQNQMAKTKVLRKKHDYLVNKQQEDRGAIQGYLEAVQTQLDNRYWNHEKNKYLQDGGILELWDDHKKTLKPKLLRVHETDLPTIISYLVENTSRKLNGQTIAQVFELVKEHKLELSKPAGNKALPADLILS